jgi:hypothetical protein
MPGIDLKRKSENHTRTPDLISKIKRLLCQIQDRLYAAYAMDAKPPRRFFGK